MTITLNGKRYVLEGLGGCPELRTRGGRLIARGAALTAAHTPDGVNAEDREFLDTLVAQYEAAQIQSRGRV